MNAMLSTVYAFKGVIEKKEMWGVVQDEQRAKIQNNSSLPLPTPTFISPRAMHTPNPKSETLNVWVFGSETPIPKPWTGWNLM